MSLEVKEEPKWHEEQAMADLYEGHVIKDELVVGPVVLQSPNLMYNLNVKNSLPMNLKQEQAIDKIAVTSTVIVKKEPNWEPDEKRNTAQECKGEKEMPSHVESKFAMTHIDEVVKQELLKCDANDYRPNGIHQSLYLQEDTQEGRLTSPDSTQEGLTTGKLLRNRNVKLQPKPILSSRMRIQYESDTEKEMRKKPKIFECNYCGKLFSLKQGLINHIRIHTGEKPYGCKICSKKFSDCAVLVRHRRMHAGQKPHTCDICGKSYSEKYLLKNHKRVHSGDMQYFCKLCPKTFVNSSNFRRHQRVHLLKYTCDICQKHFQDKDRLASHINYHNIPRPYKCKYCGKGFVQSGHMNRHLAIHTGVKNSKKHTCGVCKKVFSQKASLNKHVSGKVCEKKLGLLRQS